MGWPFRCIFSFRTELGCFCLDCTCSKFLVCLNRSVFSDVRSLPYLFSVSVLRRMGYSRMPKAQLIASDNLLPALNLATFFAGILMVSPVCGFLPWRASRLETEKVPKPTKVTLSLFLSASAIADKAPFNAFSADALLMSAAPAILSTNSFLFMNSSLLNLSNLATGLLRCSLSPSV